MSAPTIPFQPYAQTHMRTCGPGDARPTAFQVVKDCDRIGKLKGSTILITGCSSGIGVETARALYETGAALFLTARNMPKLESVINNIVAQAENQDAPRPVAIEMHLDSLASVRRGTEDFIAKSRGKLNILIENAGIMACPYKTTEDGFETQFGTNHLAHFLLFQMVKSLLLRSASKSGGTSRVVVVSSAGHRYGSINFSDIHYLSDPSRYEKFGAYGQSKTANIFFASSIHRHYGKQGLTAISLHPGTIMTELVRHLEDEDVAAQGGWKSLQNIFKSPEQGAATTVWAAVSPHFDDLANGGRYCADVGECGPMALKPGPGAGGYSPHIYDILGEEKLWELSYEAVGMHKVE
ncbi:hypothetical protein LTR56_000383 [Elasticomyces elasticus]|nr:hypothetical protein LTR56_000383 [Elasticomyces elasticus]KAK3666922.1 hypothetical protein LTR22_002147 [Elasticomyces elasticus]KAK4933376.1 hypothetical protein LTR49_000370 [Elasticomyces elasticus]KAK5755532.1 hypothetical protein LTS12_014400 [Elasticomyces elasticus]